MIHHVSPDFWHCYDALPQENRKQADQAFEHLKKDVQYPSLHFKKVGRFWSARVSGNYRALAVEGGEGLVWFWIGSHADYDKIVG